MRTSLLVIVVACGCAPSITEKGRASARIRYDIGITALGEGDTRAALRELLAAVEANPEFAEAHSALGLVFHRMGRSEDALHHYQRAVTINPKFSEAYNNLGAFLLEMERYDEAIAALEKALSDILYGTPSWAEGKLGWAYYKKGNVERGRRHLRNAVASNPRFCGGYGWLAQIELGEEKWDQVVAYCRRFEKHCLEDVEVAGAVPPAFTREMKYYLARAYLALDQSEQARQTLTDCAVGEDAFATKCARQLAELD